MSEASPSSPGDRPTIRVFISSTFRDMHAERDAINRLVFPELRRRCLLRGAEFIGVDMRWGVTEDEIQREGTLAICLHEIERSRPFFVYLLAERFGSVYPPEEVAPALVEAARAVPTLQEIVDQWYRLDDTVSLRMVPVPQFPENWCQNFRNPQTRASSPVDQRDSKNRTPLHASAANCQTTVAGSCSRKERM
jgi:hypothetical protein